ncbi:MAG TPA: proline-rich domain-containing protein [Phycisphaerae bacterium]|nr:proline-rich domain-containing protein [Phycisphaerae bacterium]
MYEAARRNAAYTLIVGCVLLVYGWMSSPIHYDELGPFYNTSVEVFFWILRLGGLAFVLIAVLAFMGLRLALFLDAAVSMICGLFMVLCGGYWIKETGLDLSRILYVVFGVMFLRASMSSLALFRGQAPAGPETPGGTEARPHPGDAASEEPPHPASVHPDSLPKDGQPPPEGYLAALSKDKTEPPDAAFK